MNSLEEKIKEIEKKLEELKEQLTEEDKEDKYKRKRFNYGDYYWFVNDLGNVIESYEDYDECNNYRYNIGNYFETKEQAENYKEKLLIEQELKDIAMELNKGEEIDWNNKEQDKYLLCFDYFYNKIDYIQIRYNKMQETIYCLDIDFKNVAIERIGKERLKKYLKGKLD